VRLLRALLHVLAVILLIVLSGATFQACVEQSERTRFPPPGQLVDIGGGRFIHLRQWGETNPGTTVVLDISASMVSSVWAWVGQGLAERGYRVVAYDRPGMAWSHGPPQPRDARHAADGLRAALDATAIPAPYVVVAHSYGGFSARVFTGLNLDRVVGLVLLDTTHPEGDGWPGYGMVYRIQAWIGHTGLFQVIRRPNPFVSLPAEEIEAAYAVTRWTSHLDTTAEELEAWPASAAQVLEFDRFADLPLLVVAGAGPAARLELQKDLVNVSDNGRFMQVDSDHVGMLLNEADAEELVQAIDQFIAMSI
jgi:pimeloyl-ACP methyl ester carboxylesterase